MRDFTSDLRELSGRLSEAKKYLRIDFLGQFLVIPQIRPRDFLFNFDQAFGELVNT